MCKLVAVWLPWCFLKVMVLQISCIMEIMEIMDQLHHGNHGIMDHGNYGIMERLDIVARKPSMQPS
jgi:hypothetical protein